MAVDSIVVTLCTIMFLQNTSTSIFAPFFPIEAQEKGIDIVWVGLLMGLFAFIYIFAAYFTGKGLKRIGRTYALRLGFLLLICQLFGMGSIYFL